MDVIAAAIVLTSGVPKRALLEAIDASSNASEGLRCGVRIWTPDARIAVPLSMTCLARGGCSGRLRRSR